MTESTPEADPFFVGWLRMPPAYARFLVPLGGLLVAGGIIAAVLLAWGQASPGTGTWDTEATTFVGIVYAEPYAMIRVPPAERGGAPRTVLLVEEGKFGAKDRVRPHDGQPVRVSGTLLSRAGRQMLELAAGDEGLVPAELSEGEQLRLRRSPPRSRGAVSLIGEIVDSKCFLGAMKPGGGRTHKGCAVLCLKGGVPPLFVPRDNGEPFYLLTNADGTPLDAKNFDLAGEPLRLDGMLEEWDDVPVLKVTSVSR